MVNSSNNYEDLLGLGEGACQSHLENRHSAAADVSLGQTRAYTLWPKDSTTIFSLLFLLALPQSKLLLLTDGQVTVFTSRDPT